MAAQFCLVVCSLTFFKKKLIIWFCREIDSEQLLNLNIMLKIGSYTSGKRRNFERAYGFSTTKYTFGKDLFTILRETLFKTRDEIRG